MKQKAPLQQPPQSASEQTSTTRDNESTGSEQAYTDSTYSESAYNEPSFDKPVYFGSDFVGSSPEEMMLMMGADAFIHLTTAPDVYEAWRKDKGLDKDPVYQKRHETRMRMMHPSRYKDEKSEEALRLRSGQVVGTAKMLVRTAKMLVGMVCAVCVNIEVAVGVTMKTTMPRAWSTVRQTALHRSWTRIPVSWWGNIFTMTRAFVYARWPAVSGKTSGVMLNWSTLQCTLGWKNNGQWRDRPR